MRNCGAVKGSRARLALPAAVALAGVADPLVGPLALVAHAGVDRDELVAAAGELVEAPRDDLRVGWVLSARAL